MKLPDPGDHDGGLSLAAALGARRTVREFADAPLSLAEVSRLLWAAQGENDPSGRRTAPSAGATYPLETVLVAGNVEGLEPGVYRYRPRGHELERISGGDPRARIAALAAAQDWIAEAAALVVLGAVAARTTAKYDTRGHRYVLLEAGHAAQNVLLQAAALGLAAAVVGAFDDDVLKATVGLARDEEPLYMVTVGRRR